MSAFIQRKDGRWEALQDGKGACLGLMEEGACKWVRDQSAGLPSVLGEHLSQHRAGKEQSPLMKLCTGARLLSPSPLLEPLPQPLAFSKMGFGSRKPKPFGA